jgi:hypothetical protein
MNSEFAVHILNEDGIRKAKEIANVFDGTLNAIKDLIGIECREFSIAKTKLEEACFFAKKAMAINLINQKIE